MFATTSPVQDPQVNQVLGRLHRAAERNTLAMVRALAAMGSARMRGVEPSSEERARFFKDAYIAIPPESGEFAYLTARSLNAKRVVEFGTSFGISTLYLAAAVRDNGGGKVIGTELEPGKQAQAERNLAEAGLGGVSEVRLGDALQTLANVEGPIDLVFLDGWKELYLPVLKLLAPKLRAGAVVLADNILNFKKQLAPFVDHVRSSKNGFLSMTLPLGSGLEYAIRLGPNGALA